MVPDAGSILTTRRKTAFTKAAARAPPTSRARSTLVFTAAWSGTRSRSESWYAPSLRMSCSSGLTLAQPPWSSGERRESSVLRCLKTPGSHLVSQTAVRFRQTPYRTVERRLESLAAANLRQNLEGSLSGTQT